MRQAAFGCAQLPRVDGPGTRQSRRPGCLLRGGTTPRAGPRSPGRTPSTAAVVGVHGGRSRASVGDRRDCLPVIAAARGDDSGELPRGSVGRPREGGTGVIRGCGLATGRGARRVNATNPTSGVMPAKNGGYGQLRNVQAAACKGPFILAIGLHYNANDKQAPIPWSARPGRPSTLPA
jgi:hypothetical protein